MADNLELLEQMKEQIVKIKGSHLFKTKKSSIHILANRFNKMIVKLDEKLPQLEQNLVQAQNALSETGFHPFQAEEIADEVKDIQKLEHDLKWKMVGYRAIRLPKTAVEQMGNFFSTVKETVVKDRFTIQSYENKLAIAKRNLKSVNSEIRYSERKKSKKKYVDSKLTQFLETRKIKLEKQVNHYANVIERKIMKETARLEKQDGRWQQYLNEKEIKIVDLQDQLDFKKDQLDYQRGLSLEEAVDVADKFHDYQNADEAVSKELITSGNKKEKVDKMAKKAEKWVYPKSKKEESVSDEKEKDSPADIKKEAADPLAAIMEAPDDPTKEINNAPDANFETKLDLPESAEPQTLGNEQPLQFISKDEIMGIVNEIVGQKLSETQNENDLLRQQIAELRAQNQMIMQFIDRMGYGFGIAPSENDQQKGMTRG